MLIYNMYREHKFPMTITNLTALFFKPFEHPLYACYSMAIEVELLLLSLLLIKGFETLIL